MTTFQAFDDMTAALSNAMEAADSKADVYQKTLSPGDHFVIVNEDFVAYGEILDPVAGAADSAEERYLKEVYAEPHMQNYRFARTSSPMCPNGELGDIHVSSVMQKISAEQFEFAKSVGFPQDRKDLMMLLNVQKSAVV